MCSAVSSPTALPTRLRIRLATLALALFANAFAMSNPFPCAQLPVKPAAWSADAATWLTPSLSADTPSSRLTPSLSRARADAPFMVMSFGLTDDREAVGYYAGFVLSAFMLGRLSSYV